MLNVRGFDLRQIPFYIDGIPVYVPYDGYVDLSRFLTKNISAIDVSKGFSSLVYGTNSMGGAINLFTQKTNKKLQIEANAGLLNRQGYTTDISWGQILEKYFGQFIFAKI